MKLIITGFIAATFSLAAGAFAAENKIPMAVTISGFEPDSITVKAGKSNALAITRKTDSTCATEIVIPRLKIKRDLPLDKTVVVSLGKLAKGRYPFGCGMDLMIKGELIVE